MTHRVSWLRVAAAFCVVGAAWSAAPAHAGMFDDNEARRAVLRPFAQQVVGREAELRARRLGGQQ